MIRRKFQRAEHFYFRNGFLIIDSMGFFVYLVGKSDKSICKSIYEQYPITKSASNMIVNCTCNDWINNFTKFSATLANYYKLLHTRPPSSFLIAHITFAISAPKISHDFLTLVVTHLTPNKDKITCH